MVGVATQHSRPAAPLRQKSIKMTELYLVSLEDKQSTGLQRFRIRLAYNLSLLLRLHPITTELTIDDHAGEDDASEERIILDNSKKEDFRVHHEYDELFSLVGYSLTPNSRNRLKS
jgi:hypothetical protein